MTDDSAVLTALGSYFYHCGASRGRYCDWKMPSCREGRSSPFKIAEWRNLVGCRGL
uniref:Uncharacterized protein n=1 Tax=Anguilla anguilla TaxID=7936 RepID=A0A0E9QV17_ANGAN